MSNIEYASLFAYCPWRRSGVHIESRDLTYDLKGYNTEQDSALASGMVAGLVCDATKSVSSPLAGYFGERCTLAPVPNSDAYSPGAPWVPWDLVLHMTALKLGRNAIQLARRTETIPKASVSRSGRRSPMTHYNTVEIKEQAHEIGDIILVDDVVTSGATILGVASRLAERFPDSEIKAFAAVRTINDPEKFKMVQPTRGTITLDGEYTIRDP